MNKIIYGVDCDSEKHGIAIFHDGRLEHLTSLNLPIFIDLLVSNAKGGIEILVSIEDVMANKFIYTRNNHANPAVLANIAMKVGRNQQAQVELMRMLDHHGIKHVLHKPQSGNWADNKKLFEMATGWKGNSNSDTRSAAYFGMLEIQSKRK